MSTGLFSNIPKYMYANNVLRCHFQPCWTTPFDLRALQASRYAFRPC
jgi:hypothetical protein